MNKIYTYFCSEPSGIHRYVVHLIVWKDQGKNSVITIWSDKIPNISGLQNIFFVISITLNSNTIYNKQIANIYILWWLQLKKFVLLPKYYNKYFTLYSLYTFAYINSLWTNERYLKRDNWWLAEIFDLKNSPFKCLIVVNQNTRTLLTLISFHARVILKLVGKFVIYGIRGFVQEIQMKSRKWIFKDTLHCKFL